MIEDFSEIHAFGDLKVAPQLYVQLLLGGQRSAFPLEPLLSTGRAYSRRVKEWRKRNPGYWRKKESSAQTPLQEVCQEQLAENEELKSEMKSDALQEVFLMQPAVVVGLISMMTGNSLQEDIAETARVLVRKGRDILQSNPGWEPARFSDENQTSSVSRAAAPSAASV